MIGSTALKSGIPTPSWRFGSGAATEPFMEGWTIPAAPAAMTSRVRQMVARLRPVKAMLIRERSNFLGTWFHAEDAILEP